MKHEEGWLQKSIFMYAGVIVTSVFLVVVMPMVYGMGLFWGIILFLCLSNLLATGLELMFMLEVDYDVYHKWMLLLLVITTTYVVNDIYWN